MLVANKEIEVDQTSIKKRENLNPRIYLCSKIKKQKYFTLKHTKYLKTQTKKQSSYQKVRTKKQMKRDQSTHKLHSLHPFI